MFQQIIKFWFEEIEPAQWWKKSDGFDALLTDRFSRVYARASCCELFEYRNEILGRRSTVAEIEFLKRPDSGF